MADGETIYLSLSRQARDLFAGMIETWADCDAVDPEVTDRFEALGLVRSVIAHF